MGTLERTDEAPSSGARARLHELTCVIHVHSTFSDGTATVPEIIDAAAAADADAVLLTDHDSREAARRGHEGWHDGVLLLVGHEISTRAGHLLAFGLDEEVAHAGLTEAEICAEVQRRGGFGFAAHPFSRGSRISTRIGRPHPWSALPECSWCGVELWSLVTDAAERWRTPAEALRFLRGPETVLDGPPRDNLAAWDRLCRERRVPAIGGLDAHQSGVRIAGRVLSPMPHRRYFRMLRTHVLLDRAPTGVLDPDRELLYQALREGRSFLAVDALAPADGFEFRAESPQGEVVDMGGIGRAGEWTLQVRAPRSCTLRVVRDGETVVEEPGTDALDLAVGAPGAYRAEATLPDGGRERTWVVSNPVYLRGGE